MTTHRRAWIQRAGVVVALALSALFALPAAPASAEDPTVRVIDGPGSLGSGQSSDLTFEVKNNEHLPPGSVAFRITVGSTAELRCEGQHCDRTVTINNGESQQFTVKLVAGNVQAGQSKSVQVQISATADVGSHSVTHTVTVRGPNEKPTVKEISGRVTNSADGEPIEGASVAINDPDGHRYTTQTDANGNYRFVGSQRNPITPGAIQIGAIKDDAKITKTINVQAGQSITERLVLEMPSATPTATPSAETSESAEATPTDDGVVAAPQPTAASNEDDGMGMGTILLIIVGGLLVALGVGAIVLLLMRRKEDDGEDDAGESDTRGAGGTGRAADTATRVVNRAGAAADPTMVARPSLADAPTTMLQRPIEDEFRDPYGAPPAPPTRPNYGADADTGWAGSGYGNASAGYGAGPDGGYGSRPTSGGGYGNAPASGGGGYGGSSAYGTPGGSGRGEYGGPSRGGYQDRYDEPTGRYDEPTSRYDEPTSRYDVGGPGQSSYGQSGEPRGGYGMDRGAGYGRPDDGYGADRGGSYGADRGAGYGADRGGSYGTDGGGYGMDRGAGYGRPDDGYGADRGGSYGQSRGPAYGDEQGYGGSAGGGYRGEDGYGRSGYEQSGYGSGGYGQRGGYEERGGGYDGPSGYDRVPEQQRGGYDQEQGGYYGGDQGRRATPQPPTRSERRSLDWLDD